MSAQPRDPLDGERYDFWGEPVEIGIDEAGRGPVLGPMVYGCAFWPARDEQFSKNMKKEYGFADSKQLTEKQRERIFAQIKETHFEKIGYFTAVLSAEHLSNDMLAEWNNGGRNLNRISHDTALELILKVRDTLGFTVKRVYLDTVGNADKYKAWIQQKLNDPAIEVRVESKADDKYPVVSAASICAKVTRDHELVDFVYREQGKEFSTEYGCGYPGDKVTRKWLENHMDPVFGFPSLVRFSWKTSYERLDKEGFKVEWFDKASDPDKVNKFQMEKMEKEKFQREELERNRLTSEEKERKMNLATHRLDLQRGFDIANF